MTPKQKAAQLINAMSFSINNVIDYQTGGLVSGPHPTNLYSKQCALIAVDEIIGTLNYDIRDLDVRGNVLLDLIDYWREVKQEIEKL